MFDRRAELYSMEVTKPQSVGTTLRRLWGYFRNYYFALFLVVAAIVAGTYMQVLIPDLTGQVVDCYLGPFGARTLGGNLPGVLPLDNLPASGNLEASEAFGN